MSEPRSPIIRAFDAISRQRRSLALLISSVVIGVLLAPIVALGILPTPWAGAVNNNVNIDFIAAGPFTYSHATGVGGEYDGRLISKTQGVNESLEGGDFNCGDRVVYFAAVELENDAAGTQNIEIDFRWDSEPSQGTIGFDDLELATLNVGDSGNLGLEGNEAASIVPGTEILTVVPGQDHLDATVAITNLDAGERFILRLVTLLTCPDSSNPNGNLQARVMDARQTAPVIDTIPAGGQVVPMMGLADVFTGAITIIKNAVPNSTQDFAFTATGDDVANFTLDDDGTDTLGSVSSQTFPNLDDGIRTITETPLVAGWTLSNIVCTGATNSVVTIGAAGGFNPGDNAVTINLADEENVTCTFTNTQQGSITIVKDAAPNDLQDFAFTSPGLTPTSFNLDDDNVNANPLSNTQTFSGLVPGARTITETPAVAGWTLTNIGCTGATASIVTIGAAGGFDAGDTSVTIDLAPGENVTCTFTNTRQPSSITIVKDAVPNDAQDFGFTTVGAGLQSFDLDDDLDGTLSNTAPFGALDPGVRTITETPADGWTLSNIVCTGATNSIVTIGAVGGFNAGDTSVTINLAPGENVTCTFTNTRQPSSITIVKDAVPNDAQDFGFTTAGDGIQNFNLDDDGNNANTLSDTEAFGTLDPGVRTITETPVAGWTLSNIVCTGATNSIVTIGAAGGFNAGDTFVTINLAPGEDVSCTFTNTRQPSSITIVKDAVPNDAQDFAFTTVGAGLQSFNLDDDSNATLSNTQVFGTLDPGVRTITETPVAGWTLSNIVCTGATNSIVTIGAAGGFNAGDTAVTINLAPGENVNCKFTNTKQVYGGNDPGDVDPGDPYGQDPVDPNVVNPYVPAPTAPTTTTPVDTNAGVAGDTNPLNPVADQPQVLGGEAERPVPDTGGGLLPRTGAGLLGEGMLALLLVGAGVVMMRIGRRRRTQTSA